MTINEWLQELDDQYDDGDGPRTGLPITRGELRDILLALLEVIE